MWISGLHAMSARHWMIGCLIGLAGVGSAMATDLDARDITAGSHSAVEGSSSRDAGGGDVLELNREHAATRRANDADASEADSRGAGGGSERSGHVSAPTSARPATLGWQSLLPGSIQ